MKKPFLYGLACVFLHAGFSYSQSATLMPPIMTAAPDAPPSGPTDLFGGVFERCRPVASRVWGDSEFLLWWTKKVPVNTPLLTQALGTTDPTAGAIGSANTRILLGDQSYDLGTRFGGRFTVGAWLDSEHMFGLEADYLFISPRSTTDSFGSGGAPGSPQLAFPFKDATTGKESALVFTIPGTFSGSSYLRLSDELQGAEINFSVRILESGSFALTGLAGFRWINFQEDLDFQQGNVGLPTGPAAGQIFTAADHFRATNNFYGGQLGLRGEYRLGNFFLEGTGKVALGSSEQLMNINGVTNAVFSDGFRISNGPGGTYALGTNIGTHTHNAFCVVPEAEFKIGYYITRYVQIFAGYNFLYLSDVARPGMAIDHTINTTQSAGLRRHLAAGLVGTPPPTFSFSRGDFWAQGVTFGLQFKFLRNGGKFASGREFVSVVCVSSFVEPAAEIFDHVAHRAKCFRAFCPVS